MIKFIHTADVHLGGELRNTYLGSKLSATRKKEIKETFYDMIEYASDNNFNLFIIAGDLFEEDLITLGELKELAYMMKSHSNLQFFMCAGNHDAICHKKASYMKVGWPENVYIFDEDFDKFYIPELNLVLHSMSWKTKYMSAIDLQQFEIEEDKHNILILHGDIYGKDSRYLPIDLEILRRKKFDYVALGHIHKKDFLSEHIAYCGSPEPLNFGESGKHGFIEGTINHYQNQFKFVPFAKREYKIVTVNIDEEMTMVEVKNQIMALDSIINIENNFYRIVLTGIYDKSIDEDISNLEEEIREWFAYVEVKNEAVPNYNLDKLYSENKYNLIGAFIKAMSEKDLAIEINKKTLYIGLEALLKSKGDKDDY